METKNKISNKKKQKITKANSPPEDSIENENENESVSQNDDSSNHNSNSNNADDDYDDYSIDENNNWSQYHINPKLASNLSKIFPEPTNIQKKTLIYNTAKVDLIIQARTGEGKTLCYAIPVLNYIFNFYERNPKMTKKISPVAIILVPTHELGVQVKKHIEMVIKDFSNKNNEKNILLYNIKVVNVLGGFAKPKQLKILNKYNPEIIVATPGRLWEIIENDEAPILDKVKFLKFLIIDEADRMTQTGHYNELKNIIEHIYTRIEIKNKQKFEKNDEKMKEKLKKLGFQEYDFNKNLDDEENKKIAESLNVDFDNIETIDPMELMGKNPDLDTLEFQKNKDFEEEEDENEEEENENEEENNEEKIDEKNDKKSDEKNNEENDEKNEEENEEGEEEEENENDENNDDGYDDEEENEKVSKKEIHDMKKNIKNIHKDNIKEGEEIIEYEQHVNLRTILCSATIDSLKRENPFKKSKNKKKDNKTQNDQTSAQKHFQNLIKNLKFYNKLLYIKLKGSENLFGDDLENIDKEKLEKYIDIKKPSMLPAKLEIDSYKCENNIKDYYLYFILRKHINQKIIIFTNSISHTKKLHSIFSFFNEFICCSLHSRMLQNVRMRNLDKFSNNKNAILFCTDVGARGLDIPKVDLVIHYHIPKRTDIFVHRSGRTARANQSGKVSSLISGKEMGLYKRIMMDLNYKQFAMNTLPVSQLEKIKSLFEYVKELEKENFKNVKNNREKMWYESAAKQCDMIYDDYGEGREYASDDEERREKEQQKKFLNKKRKIESKEKFKKKKIYSKLNEHNIKRSSFLVPDQVEKLNAIMKDEDIKNNNITQALFEAKQDMVSLRPRYKPKQRRYMKRRKGK